MQLQHKVSKQKNRQDYRLRSKGSWSQVKEGEFPSYSAALYVGRGRVGIAHSV